ncbi:MAG: hypothetical protein ACR2JU_10795 [Nocardioidaceae bacterium]
MPRSNSVIHDVDEQEKELHENTALTREIHALVQRLQAEATGAAGVE